MTISFYDASVGSYLQVLGGTETFLGKGLAWCQEKNLDPEEIVETRLYPDMLPFRYQVHSLVHHSLGTIEAIKSGTFRPPSETARHSYAELQAYVARAREALGAFSPAEIDALADRDVSFEGRSRKLPFTATGFLLSFSLPNFYFHVTTAYDILRSKGVPIGKLDYIGTLRFKG